MPKDANQPPGDLVNAALDKLSSAMPHPAPSADVVRRVAELTHKAEFHGMYPIEPRDADDDPTFKGLIKALHKMCQSKDRLTKLEIMAIWRIVGSCGVPKKKEPTEKPKAKKKSKKASESSSESSSERSSTASSERFSEKCSESFSDDVVTM